MQTFETPPARRHHVSRPLQLALGLLLATGGLANASETGPDVDWSLKRPTAQQKYLARMRPLAYPVRIDKAQMWEIRLTTPTGEPVSQALIDVHGRMPEQRHAFDLPPRVARELGDGRYLLKDVKFDASGWWEISLDIDGRGGVDRVTFNTDVPRWLPLTSEAAP